LPKETTITVSEKPLLVLTYEIYGETESFDKILNLNNFTEFDDLGGIVRVLE
jgi:prophage DNA circulation protein